MLVSRIRLQDVADSVGLSKTTVSLILNGRQARIAEETRQRVLVTAQRMGYHPHASARALALRRSNQISVVVDHPDGLQDQAGFYIRLFVGILNAAPPMRRNLLIHAEPYADLAGLVGALTSGASDGAILIGRPEPHDPLPAALLERNLPVVCVCNRADHPNCYHVDCDNVQGGYLGVRHLLEIGRQRILFLSPGLGVSWGRERRQGALLALSEAGLPPDALLAHDYAFSSAVAIESDRLLEILRAPHAPNAIFCCEERHAASLTPILLNAGFRIPQDVALVGFNDSEISENAPIPLTSVRQPLREMGAEALRRVVALSEGETLEERVYRAPVSLVVRESTAGDASV
jgi:LacI family transcriptional regulator